MGLILSFFSYRIGENFMKKSIKTAGFAALLVSLSLCAAQARDVTYFLPIKNVFESYEAKSKLRGPVKFYFGNQSHPDVAATLAKNVVVYKKGSISSKTHEETCDHVMLAVLREFMARARKLGGDAVVHIESYYKDESFSSNDKFECHAGYSRAGVALRGDIVRLRK
jgi:uncharacterized protein YbjQ (UPF0145 family)